MKICNYRKYLTTIFIHFFFFLQNKCVLKAILLDKIYCLNFSIKIDNKQYLCEVNEINARDIIKKRTYPFIQNFYCNKNPDFGNISKIFVSGIPRNFKINQKIKDINRLPNQFIISRIINQKKTYVNKMIIKPYFYKLLLKLNQLK